MSKEDEGFLNRWSRRKQEAAKDTAETVAQKSEDVTPAGEQAAIPEPAEEEFDVSKLPPIESITAGTDIRAFLSKGVPAALTQAALRRAWSADPAIRDYIGLSEYSWDFNSPGIDGFGPLDPGLNVQEMVADVFGKVKQAVTDTEALADPSDCCTPQTAVTQTEATSSVDSRLGQTDSSVEHEEVAHPEIDGGDKSAQSAAASQQAESESEPAPLPVRRHGSALPG